MGRQQDASTPNGLTDRCRSWIACIFSRAPVASPVLVGGSVALQADSLDQGNYPDPHGQLLANPASRNGKHPRLHDASYGSISPHTTSNAVFKAADETAGRDGSLLEAQREDADGFEPACASWLHEVKTLISFSAPLIVTFFLQYSINVTSIFAVGRIGTVELGAVTLANMTSGITCLAPILGLATSLDTLCAQAYGSGNKHLVGIYCQRMAIFLFCLCIPIATLWVFSEPIFRCLVSDAESARLASQYLKVMIFAIPGIVLLETGKRFFQAQGLFRVLAYILLVAAPLNVFISWLLVWKLGLGFLGAPIAVVITRNLLPLLLVLYAVFIDGSQCWGGFSRRAFVNWTAMVTLGISGMIMVEAEWLAFEVTTILSAKFGTVYLASQSVLVTLTTIFFQIPFPMSIAASTRVAGLIGAGLVDSAKTAAKVGFVGVTIVGLFNFTVFVALRSYLPLLFTGDKNVISLTAQVLPTVAVMQFFDALSAGANGLLRGIGRQSVGGIANIAAYYLIALPVSFLLVFSFDWKLEGLWLGFTIGLIMCSLIEYIYLIKTDWYNAAQEAVARNEAC